MIETTQIRTQDTGANKLMKSMNANLNPHASRFVFAILFAPLVFEPCSPSTTRFSNSRNQKTKEQNKGHNSVGVNVLSVTTIFRDEEQMPLPLEGRGMHNWNNQLLNQGI